MCGGPFCTFGLGCLLLHCGPSVLGRRVRTGLIATHLGPAYAQTMPPFAETLVTCPWQAKLLQRVIADRYNGIIIKTTHLLSDETKLLQKSYDR